jgi:hypothetical protein
MSKPVSVPELLSYVPFEQWEYKTVEFPVAATAVRVSHSLKARAPRDVVYLQVGNSTACIVSDAITADSFIAEWFPSSIVLQSNVVATVKLLLAIPKLTNLES